MLWTLVVVAVVATSVLPEQPVFDGATVVHVAFPTWCAIGRLCCVGLLACVGGSALVAAFVPGHPGRALAITLVGCRLVRFVFAVAAAAFGCWAIVSAVRGGFALHDWLVELLTPKRSVDLTPLHMYTPPPQPAHLPAAFNVMTMAAGGILVVAMVIAIVPMCRDLAKLIVGSIRVRQYVRWAKHHDRDASAPEARLWDRRRTTDILLVSDLHGTEPDGRTLEGDIEDAPMRAFVIDAIAKLQPKLVLAAGDITDNGAATAWDRMGEVFRSAPKAIVAPGNHDVNFKSRTSYLQHVGAMLDIDPDGDHATSYRASEVATSCAAVMRLDGIAAKRKERHYPVLYTDAALATHVLVFNSNERISTSPITNALGLVGSAQLADAATLLHDRAENERSFALIIVLHHHIFQPPRPSAADLFLICQDAGQVLEFAIAHGASVLVHGHEHMPHARTVQANGRELLVLSLGSALYAAKGPCADTVVAPSVVSLTRTEWGFSAAFVTPALLPSANAS
jgi:3',5'-cyclic AMP phosphodiesterase CpdA